MHPIQSPRFKALAILLVVALLAAQWVGLRHRIVHGSGVPAVQALNEGVSTFAVNWGDPLHHSCVAFESASVGAAVASVCFAIPIVPNIHVLALWIAFASWQAPHISYFSPRAPPA